MTATVEQLKEKIELFRKNLKDYKNKNYDEYKTRADFIDVFFASLGWDMYNEQKIIEQFREVVREDRIVIDGSKKAPDYSFRIGPHIVFYVEAKKPSVDIKNNPEPALQLRRYAHTRGLALSILTDFEEIAVYDTESSLTKRIPPLLHACFTAHSMNFSCHAKCRAMIPAMTFFLTHSERQAVLNGSFNRYVETNKKGTSSVDRGFLDLLNKWRQQLAENIALKNEDIDEYNLNIIVQKLIDRLIFLRIAEDRLIEKPNLLLETSHKENVYAALNNIFSVADVKYNSSLFSSEAWMVVLNIEDKVLNEIIDQMYPPKCPYEFSVLPIEILGHAYEQFLGKTIRFIRKTKFGHSIEVEEKPEVRKAGGVYYTPDYIVDYIVENTVGVLLQNKGLQPLVLKPLVLKPLVQKSPVQKPLAPEEIAALKILDPACGSGSFLIGAYDYLVRYHLEYYLKTKARRDKALSAGIIYLAGEDKYKLSTKVKSEILVNNIFGVDIDPQAVEVTKLSLLLKVLEDDNLEYREQLFKTEQMHLLPDLSTNIKCGNSLIGSDYLEDKNLEMFGTAEMRKVNVFDWEKEFKEVFKTSTTGASIQNGKAVSLSHRAGTGGGFDCVIGNPPYGASIKKEELDYIIGKLPAIKKNPDSYCAFTVKSLLLTNKNGYHSFIVPNTFCDIETCDEYRKFLLTTYRLNKIYQSGWAFKDAVVDTIVYIFIKKPFEANDSVEIQVNENIYKRTINSFFGNNLIKIDYRNSEIFKSFESGILKKTIPFGQIAIIKAGVKMYEKGKGIPQQTEETMKQRPYSQKDLCPNGWRNLFRGDDIGRYFLKPAKEFVNYGPWLAAPRTPELFNNPKILMRRTDYRLLSVLDNTSSICVNSCHVIKLKEEKYSYLYVLGLLNSKLLQRFFELQNPQMVNKVFSEIKVIYVERLPFKNIDFDNENEKNIYDKIVKSVESIMGTIKQLLPVKVDNDRIMFQQKIDAIDKQIDRLVYDLYGLTEDEIRIVEGG